MSAYIVPHYRVSQAANDLVTKWLKEFNKETRHFFVHVLFHSVHNTRDDQEYCPVPSKLMQKKWGKSKVDWKGLVNAGLIKTRDLGDGRDYSKVLGICREYKVNEAKVQEFLAVEKKAVDAEGLITVNLVDGRKMRTYARYELKKANGTAIPDLVKESMQSIKSCVINLPAVESYLTELEGEILLGSPTEREKKRFRTDTAALTTLKKCNLKRREDGLAEYEPGYRMQSSGRITEIGVGMQNCTREMKDLAFNGIPGLVNYDLKSSQIWGLIQWFEEASLNPDWLVKYLETDKQVYADAIGISKDCWKKCLMALVMGGEGLSKAEQKDLQAAKTEEEMKEAIRHKIVEYLLEEAGGDIEKMIELEAKFNEVTADLQTELEKWHRWLIEDHPKTPGVSSYPRGVHTLTNASGATFNLSEWQDKNGKWVNKGELGRKLAAFWLQGTEAAFIHHLTIISEKYGYQVMNNQHDGLVTLGEIPEAAVEIARERSGLKYASLEVKPFL